MNRSRGQVIRIRFKQRKSQQRELISAQNMQHKHNNKDLSRLRYLSPAMSVNTRYINSTRDTSSKKQTRQTKTRAMGLSRSATVPQGHELARGEDKDRGEGSAAPKL